MDSEEYVMVRVGKMWVRRRYINDAYPDKELTEYFRSANHYTDKKIGGFIPPLNSIKLAHKHAKKYGGEVVRVKVDITPFNEGVGNK